MNLAIFVSGSGTNMENLVLAIRERQIPCHPAVVICDKPGAQALERAARLGVDTAVIDRKLFTSKGLFEEVIMDELEKRKIDFIALAGFMRILSAAFVNRYLGRLINIHPSCLPAFPGAHAIRDAFEAKVSETGVTVHFVIPEVDAGPVILQGKVTMEPRDTFEALEGRIHALEYKLYPSALELICSGKAVFKTA